MTYTVKHSSIDRALPVSVTISGDFATVRCSEKGSFRILFPGKLHIGLFATYFVHFSPEPVGLVGQDPDSTVGGKPVESHLKSLPLTLEIKTPDGQLFTADHVTLSDLQRFRDLRGISQGLWTFSIHGESEPIRVDSTEIRVTANKGHLGIAVEETVTSQSAPPLVNDMLAAHTLHRYTFDLFRVGTFTATARSGNPFLNLSTPRTLNLLDPDGAIVATSNRGRLIFPVTLETLDKSRTSAGAARPWSLEVLPSLAPADNKPTAVLATVIETARIHTSVLQERIDFLIGKGGSKLAIFGEMQGSDLLARLKILDIFSAETIDMYELFDSVIKVEPPDSIDANVVYTLASHTGVLGGGITVSLHGLKISAINISIGASEKIQPAIPAVKLEVGIEGHAAVEFHGVEVGTVKIRDNHIHLEAGLRLNADGSFSPEAWIEDDLLDIDIDAAILAGLLLVNPVIGLTAAVVVETIENEFNAVIPDGFRKKMTDVMGKVSQILAVMLGDDFTYRSLRLEGDDIVLDYIAPLEPEPKPSAGYRGIIGRSATQLGPDAWRISPPSLGDTWKADNLAKIDHIVVVMMENRSFDHVLGYRAQLPGGENSDGLNTELTAFLESLGFPVRKFNQPQSKIIPNALGFKTKFPVSVGHELADVIEQLDKKIQMKSGRFINSPAGFISNFAPKAEAYSRLHTDEIIVKEDVLGYYEANDLPFFKFLAENYAYCEKFYCSHPGPTLPNRTFSITGTLQYARTGEGIPDNNNSDNFFLSRAMTIFDLLTRKRIGWRVYESAPSVTMLRMFARYVTDNTNIVPISQLQQDIDQGNLPAVTIIDPAMHHFPESDDHSPAADMYNGQRFLTGVYDTLRSNEALWRKTLLVITYDEHGGFYDHVIPPMAEVRTRPAEVSDPNRPPIGHFTPSTLTTNYGLRVPTFIVSPWTPAGKGPDIVLDFSSILKTMIARFCGQDRPFLSDRVNASRSFDAFLSEATPRMNVPDSPTLPDLPDGPQKPGPAIVTPPMSRKQMRSGNVDYHALTGMLARQLGR